MKRKLVTVDAETLLATPMSKTMFIVDGLIPQGVNVLSGAAKIGKSWLMLWLGLQVSQGLPVWGIPTMHCDVLYLCLEDTQRRIKDRLFDLTNDPPKSFHLSVTCGLIGNGLEEEIINFLEDFPKTKLVIIATLQKVRDSRGSAGKTGMYGNDYDDISAIKKIADERDISIILGHHLRKLKDGQCIFIWQLGLRAGQPDTLLNQKVMISNYMPLPAAGNKAILYGDLSYYWLADREGRSLQRLDELYAAQDQVGFKITQRVDGRLLLREAVKCLQMKAA